MPAKRYIKTTLPVKSSRAKRKSFFRKRANSLTNPTSHPPGKLIPFDSLNWKRVNISGFLDDYHGLLGFDEVDDVNLAVNNNQLSSLPDQLPSEHPATNFQDIELCNSQSLSDFSDSESQWDGCSSNQSDHSLVSSIDVNHDFASYPRLTSENFPTVSLPEWNELMLSNISLLALSKLGFTSPTLIQKATIPQILSGNNVIGKASTGSGKTLAYTLPILEQYIRIASADTLSSPTHTGMHPQSGPLAVIFSPTRELAHQIRKSMCELFASALNYRDQPQTVTLTGGLSLQKQLRLLTRAHIVIGTPGRIAEIIETDDNLINWFTSTRFLVIDEADRLLKRGYYEDFKRILEIFNRCPIKPSQSSPLPLIPNSEHYHDDAITPSENDSMRQVLVFSATYRMDLQRSLKFKESISNINQDKHHSLSYLYEALPFKSEPIFVDVNPDTQLAENLNEGLLECKSLEKDLYLYACLLVEPCARVIIFTNSIHTVRRLKIYLERLNFQTFALHSNMTQKARLKALEQFKLSLPTHSNKCANGRQPRVVLIATDVAARGLDIPSTHMIIHYHVPRTADAYVHRSGRTARAGQRGKSIMLCSPEEVTIVENLKLKIQSDSGKSKHIQRLSLNHDVLERMRDRFQLAKWITESEMEKTCQSVELKWEKKAREDLGTHSSDDMEFCGRDRSVRGRKKREKLRSTRKEEIETAKRELKNLLSRKINVGVSERYITSGNVDIEKLCAGAYGEFIGQVDGLGWSKDANSPGS